MPSKIRTLTRRVLPTSLLGLVLAAAGCSSGTAPASSSGGTGSSSGASCTVTLSGDVSTTQPCKAIVGYYEGKMSVAILQDDDELQDETLPVFRFAAALSNDDRLSPGTYDPSNVLEAAASAQARDTSGDGGSSETKVWAAAFQGSNTQGSFRLQILSAGTPSSGLYVGTRGNVDVTMPAVPPATGTLTARAEFTSMSASGG